MKDYTGDLFCYVYYYVILFGLVAYQYQSFFISLFRYVCINHGNILMNNDITIKVNWNNKLLENRNYVFQSKSSFSIFQRLARWTVFCMAFFPAIVVLAFSIEENEYPAINSCLGKPEANFAKSRGFVCNGENWVENIFCRIILYVYVVTSCNVLEVFFLYKTYKHIEAQTNAVKNMIGKDVFVHRKK